MDKLYNLIPYKKIGYTLVIGGVYLIGNYLKKRISSSLAKNINYIDKKDKKYEKEEKPFNDKSLKDYIEKYLVKVLKIEKIKKSIQESEKNNSKTLLINWIELKNSIIIYYVNYIILNKVFKLISISNFAIINIICKYHLNYSYSNKLVINEIFTEMFSLSELIINNIYTKIFNLMKVEVNNLDIKNKYSYESARVLMNNFFDFLNQKINYVEVIIKEIKEVLKIAKFSKFKNVLIKNIRLETKIKFYELFYDIALDKLFYESLIESILYDSKELNNIILKKCFDDNGNQTITLAKIISFMDNHLFVDKNENIENNKNNYKDPLLKYQEILNSITL